MGKAEKLEPSGLPSAFPLPHSAFLVDAILSLMRLRLLSAVLLTALVDGAYAAGPPVELEIVTEQGVQITAPQQWLQLLTGIGIDHVQVRGGQSGDEPKITNQGTARTASYHVVGVLTSRDQLRLPGGTFSRSDRAQLKDYFAKLGADGTDAVTAPHVRFGLTEKELTAVLADLAQPIDFETKGLTPRAFADQLQKSLALKPSIDAEASEAMRAAPPAVDELKGVAAGTALAITLRNCGLVMRPEKQRGQPVAYHVVVAGPDIVRGPHARQDVCTRHAILAHRLGARKDTRRNGAPTFPIAKRRNRWLQFGRSTRRDRSAGEDADVLRSSGAQSAPARPGEDPSETCEDEDNLQTSDRPDSVASATTAPTSASTKPANRSCGLPDSSIYFNADQNEKLRLLS